PQCLRSQKKHAFEATLPEAAYLLISTVIVTVTLGIILPDAADVVGRANSFLFIWWKKAQAPPPPSLLELSARLSSVLRA
ncbi:mCG141702, partial [Mus musculus]